MEINNATKEIQYNDNLLRNIQIYCIIVSYFCFIVHMYKVIPVHYLSMYLRMKLNGLGTVGCHSLELFGGKLFVSALSSPSLSMLPLLFDSLSVFQFLLVEYISLLRIVFISLSLFLYLESVRQPVRQ